VAESTPGAPTSASLDRYALRFLLASLALGLGLLLWAATRGYGAWPRTSDDMFYYFVLVREAVRHGVASSDGLRPTNGFHPLYFLVLRAIYPALPESALPGAALAFLAVCHGVTCLVLWRTLRRIVGGALAAALAGLYAANPFVIGVIFAGVETALMVLCLAVCLRAHLRWLEQGARPDRVVALLALACAVAARTDTVMLAAAMAVAPALALRSRPREALRTLDRAPLLAALLPIVAFGVWGQVATGEFLQTSGRALSFWQSVGDWRVIRGALDGLGALATPAAAVTYALYVVVQWIAWVARGPFMLVSGHLLGAVLAGARVGWRLRRPTPGAPIADRTLPTSHRRLALELLAYLVLLWAFYAVFFRHGQVWYWHSSVYVATLLLGVWLAPMRAAVAALPARLPRAVPVLGLIAAIGLSALALADLRPRRVTDQAIASAAPARDPLASVPDGATLGAFDTGQLAWEQPRLRVVNLDGLVNNAAYRALRARRIGRYMLEQRVEWLFVHDQVIERFRPFGLGAWLERAEPAGRSANGVGLYRVRSAPTTR
jgi:dolichyl-phosphate-mannose-protein mannosyltransferase